MVQNFSSLKFLKSQLPCSSASIPTAGLANKKMDAVKWSSKLCSPQTVFGTAALCSDLASRTTKEDVPMMLFRKDCVYHQWDIIAPKGFGVSILRALVFAGARAVGWEEAESTELYIAQPSFPRDFPDTAAGEMYWRKRFEEEEQAMLLRPPAKRVAIVSKRRSDWEALFKEDATEGEEGLGEKEPPLVVVRGERYLAPFRDAIPINDFPFRTLLTVLVQPMGSGRGVPESGAELFLPTEEDLGAVTESLAFDKSQPWNGVQIANNSSSGRRLVGYITSGGSFSLQGHPQGIGLIIAGCNQNLLLLRCPRSTWLRPMAATIM